MVRRKGLSPWNQRVTSGAFGHGGGPTLSGIGSLLRVRAKRSRARLRSAVNARSPPTRPAAWDFTESGLQRDESAPEAAQYGTDSMQESRGNGRHSEGKTTMPKTIGRHIRIDEGDWRRIEALAETRDTSPNRLLVEFAVEALDRREWPRNELEIQLLRSAMFAAQALARDMIAAGRAEEVEQIRRSISDVVPDSPQGPESQCAQDTPN